jgi:hypothetical protein
LNKDTDDQVALCLEQTGNDWNAIENNKKYGRLFYKLSVLKTTQDGIEYTRHEWTPMSEQLTNDDVRTRFIDYLENCSNKK